MQEIEPAYHTTSRIGDEIQDDVGIIYQNGAAAMRLSIADFAHEGTEFTVQARYVGQELSFQENTIVGDDVSRTTKYVNGSTLRHEVQPPITDPQKRMAVALSFARYAIAVYEADQIFTDAVQASLDASSGPSSNSRQS